MLITSALLILLASEPPAATAATAATAEADRACAVTLLAMSKLAASEPEDDGGASTAAMSTAMFYAGRLSVSGTVTFAELTAAADALKVDRKKLGDDALACTRRWADLLGARR